MSRADKRLISSSTVELPVTDQPTEPLAVLPIDSAVARIPAPSRGGVGILAASMLLLGLLAGAIGMLALRNSASETRAQTAVPLIASQSPSPISSTVPAKTVPAKTDPTKTVPTKTVPSPTVAAPTRHAKTAIGQVAVDRQRFDQPVRALVRVVATPVRPGSGSESRPVGPAIDVDRQHLTRGAVGAVLGIASRQ